MHILNLPSYLTDVEVTDWIIKIQNFINKERNNLEDYSFNNFLTIEFSNEIIKTEYTVQNIETVIDKISSLWPNIFKESIGFLDDKIDLMHIAALGDFISSRTNEDFDDVCATIKEIVESAVITRSKFDCGFVLGCYIDYEKKIVLYTKSIEKCSDATKTLNQCFEEVLAHEYFHAYHYSLGSIGKELVKRCDYTSKVVKESLASWFEKQYCDSNLIPCDIDLDWYNNPCSYPYAGTRYIKDRIMFNSTLEKSIFDMDIALRNQFSDDLDIFYNIKNIQLRKVVKTHSKTHPVKNSRKPNIIFSPSDIKIFKKELILKKRAEIAWIYSDGSNIVKPWIANKINASTNIIRNIQSRPEWRNKHKNGLIKVIVRVI